MLSSTVRPPHGSCTRIAAPLLMTIVAALWVVADARNSAEDARRLAGDYAQPMPGIYDAGLSASHTWTPPYETADVQGDHSAEPGAPASFTVYYDDRIPDRSAETL